MCKNSVQVFWAKITKHDLMMTKTIPVMRSGTFSENDKKSISLKWPILAYILISFSMETAISKKINCCPHWTLVRPELWKNGAFLKRFSTISFIDTLMTQRADFTMRWDVISPWNKKVEDLAHDNLKNFSQIKTLSFDISYNIYVAIQM